MATSEKKIEARRLKGFQDYNPEHMALRYRIMDVMRDEAEKSGFLPIGTPVLEYADVLLGAGGETDKQVFRFTDNGKRDVALRFDLTLPFARYVAENHGTIPIPFKRMQIGDVWRADKPQRGRFREFCQCDLDIIGVQSIEADIEILLCLQNVVARLLDEGFTMYLGNRLLLSAMVRKALGNVGSEVEAEALIAIDKLEKIGEANVVELLMEKTGVAKAGAESLVNMLSGQKSGDLSGLIDDPDPVVRAELARLQETEKIVNDCLKAAGMVLGKAKIDLSIARGLAYYTGVVFETKIDGEPGFGSICSGGRYDHLVERFLDTEFSSVGGSLGLDRLAAYLLGKDVVAQKPATAYVAIASEQERAIGFGLVQKLRNLGIKTEVHLRTQKLGQQFKRASKLSCQYVVTIGEAERLGGTYSVKDMQNGVEAKEIKFDKLIEYLRK